LARHKFWGFAVDYMGNVVPKASVSIYLAGTTTPAKVYPSRDASTPVTEPPQVQCDESGYFEFWIDDSDYSPDQLFDVVIEKDGVLICRLTNLQIVKPFEHSKLLGLLPEGLRECYHLSKDQYDMLTSGVDATSLHHHDSRYYTRDEIDSWELIKNYTLARDLDASDHSIVNLSSIETNSIKFRPRQGTSTPSGTIVGDVTLQGSESVTGSLKVEKRIGVLGYDPDSGYPSGWGGGVHTWDVYAEGSVGLGRDGKLITWVWHDPNYGARINLRDVNERDRILLFVNPRDEDTKIEVKDDRGRIRCAMYGNGAVLVGFDFKMARTVEGDFNWKRALVAFPGMLHINYECDFASGVKIWGPLLGGVALDGFTRGYTVVDNVYSCTSNANEYCTAFDGDIKGNFMIVADRTTVSKVRVYVDYKGYEIDVSDPLWMPIIVATYIHLRIDLMGSSGYKYVRVFGLKW